MIECSSLALRMRKNDKRGQGWQFSLAMLFITIVLYLPGFLVARFFYRDNMVAIAVAGGDSRRPPAVLCAVCNSRHFLILHRIRC